MLKKIKKISVFGLCLLLIGGLSGCGASKKEVDIFKNVSVSFAGVNGEGTVTVNGYKLNNDEWIKENEELYNSINFEVDKKDKLSNGNKVKVTVKYDKDLYDDANIKFTEESKEYEVNTLEIQINENSKLSAEESKTLADQIMAITYKYYMGKSGENDLYQIENNGIKSKFTFEGVYIKDDYIRTYWNKKTKDSNYFNLIFKVDYEITDMSTFYDYKEKDELTGTYYVSFDALNLAKRGKEFTYKLENNGFMEDGYIYVSNHSDVKGNQKTVNEILEVNEKFINGKLIKITE